jgi:glycosyltransferase involved in cell wall biosynthesis
MTNFITIIIPTRNRLEYLKHSIKTVLSQSYKNFNLIVVNNECSDGTYEYLNTLNDERLRVINSNKYLCMTDNFLLGLNSIDQDGWFGVIGDDDGLLPDALKCLNKLINQHDVEVIQCAKDYYRWDDIDGSKIKGGSIIINGFFNVQPSYRDSFKNIKKCLYGEMDPLDFPRFYTGGFASTSLLSKLLNRDKHFIRSSIPDIYSSLVIGLNTERYLWYPTPLVMSGTSSKSNGTATFNKVNNPQKVNTTSNGFGAIPIHSKISMDKFFFPNDNSVYLLESLYYYPEKHKLNIDMNKFIFNLCLRISISDTYSQAWIKNFLKENSINLSIKNLGYYKFIYKCKKIPSRYLRKHMINKSNNYCPNIYEASLIINNYRKNKFIYKVLCYLINKTYSFLKFFH